MRLPLPSALAVALFLSVNTVHAQQQTVYLAPDDHTDYMWTGDEAQYRQALLESTDYYLDQVDSTAKEPRDHQARWNFDSALWFYEYERNRTPEQVSRLVSRLRDGHFSMPLTFAVSTYGGTPMEATLRGMYYAGGAERKYNLHLPMALAMEDQTLPRGLGALWAGSGARYSWKGICGCATKLMPSVYNTRPHEIYWWTQPDGSRILMKWYSLHEETRRAADYNLGGYAEARDPSISNRISFLDDLDIFKKHYPYDLYGLFGEGEDNLFTRNTRFLQAASLLERPGRHVILSNEEDFFRDFETKYGKTLPSESAAYGNDWDLYPASMQEVTSGVKRATEKLRGAEAIETLVSLKRPAFPDTFRDARNASNVAFGLYWEHNWTADNHTLTRQTRAEWQRRTAAAITGYVDTLSTASASALGSLIRREGTEQRFFVFNPLSWTRDDFADLAYTGPEAVHVVDVASGHIVPSQWIDALDDNGKPAGRRLRILASGIPSTGYKVFEVRPGADAITSGDLHADGNSIENEDYKLTLSSNGAIESLLYKGLGNLQLVRNLDGRTFNDFGNGEGNVRVVNAGPVSVTLRAEVKGDVPHTTDVTLFRGIDRVAIRNDIQGNFKDVRTWTFNFAFSDPHVFHEETGVINTARLQPEGDYSNTIAKLDWLTLNHYVAMSQGLSYGMTLSSADNSFFQLGHSSISKGISTLDTKTPQINVLAGGQVDGASLGIPAQGGDTHFLQRFALRMQTHYHPSTSMRFSLEDQNPLLSGPVTGTEGSYPATEFSLLSVNDPTVQLWALKPSEEGTAKGIVTRFWNLSPLKAEFRLSVTGGLHAANAITHIETDPNALPVTAQGLQAGMTPFQVRTFSLLPGAPPVAGATRTATAGRRR